MLKNNFKFFLFILALTMVGCAKRGSITGGMKDTLAPVLISSFPKNYSTKFNSKEIKLTFDEFIKLKNLNKQLIISPPMKYEPLITPTLVSKYITIKIIDTLRPNTTYSINFGQSIEDNNEGNPYNQFKYVFSTDSFIDSLSIGGTIKDAYNKEVESFVSVMLYEVNDKFNDSVVYHQVPRYISNTLDSTKTFKLENLKAGKYLLVAMKDYASNNKFNPKKDKIGFYKEFITIPGDTIYELKLFKETLPFKALKPYQASGNKIILPYEGLSKNSKITLKNGQSELPTIITKFPQKDSLQLWYKPIKADSLAVKVVQEKYEKSYNFKIKATKKDTLTFTALQSGTINLMEQFVLTSSIPLEKLDRSKMKLTYKDTVSVNFKTDYDAYNQKVFFDFKKEILQKYSLQIMPGAMIDYLAQTNDTLVYHLSTKDLVDYGNLKVNLQNVKRFPVIVELTNELGDVLATKHAESSTIVDFNLIDPGLFWIRAIYDDNKNHKWDTGNYLEKRQAEEVIYFSKAIDVRSNWDVEQVFDLSIPYSTEPKKKEVKKKPKSGF